MGGYTASNDALRGRWYGHARLGVVDVDVHVSSYLKEKLAWAADKRLRVINTILLFKNSFST